MTPARKPPPSTIEAWFDPDTGRIWARRICGGRVRVEYRLVEAPKKAKKKPAKAKKAGPAARGKAK